VDGVEYMLPGLWRGGIEAGGGGGGGGAGGSGTMRLVCAAPDGCSESCGEIWSRFGTLSVLWFWDSCCGGDDGLLNISPLFIPGFLTGTLK
jgi:hypothetical protein